MNKRIGALIITLVVLVSSSSSVFAAGSGSASVPTPSTPSVSTSSSESVVTSVPSYVETKTVKEGAAIAIGTAKVKNNVAGFYDVNTVQGMAVIAEKTVIAEKLGLTKDQTPYVIAYDTNEKASYKAMDCVNFAVEAYGIEKVEAVVNLLLCAKENGNTVKLENGSIATVVGLPKTTDTTKTVSVICVQPGGIITILDDLDDNPATVTFEMQAGLATYAIATK